MIKNQQAIRFANEKGRLLADLIQKMDRTAEQFLLAVVQDFENQTGNDANDAVIDDGSLVDGRNQITKENVAQLKYVVEQLRACMGTDDRRAIVSRFAVNGQPLY